MSADILDNASDVEQRERDLALAKVRHALDAQQSAVTYHSHCAWCHEPSLDGRTYCSYGLDSCAEDARREQSIRGRQRA